MIKITLPMPPSVNCLFAGMGRRRFKSKKYNDWLKIADISTKSIHDSMTLPERPYKATLYMYANWFNKDGSIKRKDCSNYEKSAVDYIDKIITGFDDKLIFKNTQVKIQSDREEVEIVIEKYEID